MRRAKIVRSIRRTERGRISGEVASINGIQNGNHIILEKTSILRWVASKKNGNTEGYTTVFYDSGILSNVRERKDGYMTGVGLDYGQNGVLQSKTYFTKEHNAITEYYDEHGIL
jgi:antitoxin component YwqK of YwqJK toxin-antitoxin module